MKPGYFRTIALSFILLFLVSWVTDSSVLAAASDPAVFQAKKEAEAKGYSFFTTHDEIVAMAKKEGKLRVSSGMEPPTFKPLIDGFKQRYPFITDIHVEEVTGPDAYQRFILEMKSGHAKAWDIAHIPRDFAPEYPPYLKKHDILGMAKHGILRISAKMIHPVDRNMVSVTSSITGVTYNRKLISEDKVPAKWEDFLKPEFKGRKFVLDIRPSQVAGLVPAWGLERTLDYARKLAAQQPVWSRGGSRSTSSLAAGEYSLSWGPNFSTAKRPKDPTGSLSYKIIEPVPTTVVQYGMSILNAADHPHAALLWLEFLASPEGQEILDKYGYFSASVFTPGSVIEQMTRGKELSVVDWDHFTKLQEYSAKLVAAYGFPKADK